MTISRAVKKFLSSRLIMNSKQLWNLRQRHKLLRTEASGEVLKSSVSEMAFPGVSRGIFHRGRHVVLSEYAQETGNNAVEMSVPSHAFHDIAWFERSQI